MKYKFKRQYSIDSFIIDFYSPEIKLAVELDGNVHELPEQKEYDIKRQKHIEKFGVTFIRITNEEFLGNPNKAFERIEMEIKRLSNIIPSPKGTSPSQGEGQGLSHWDEVGENKVV